MLLFCFMFFLRLCFFFFFQAEDGIRDLTVTGVQTCALPILFEVLESAMDRDVVPLGSAFPSPGLFPLRRLGQCLAHAAREADPRSAIDDLTPGSLALRRQIARRYLADGLALTPADLVITNGALEEIGRAHV